jgi:hypothetical protein
MTSFAFILGCVPLWTAAGSGAISRQSIGTTVVTGMLAATAIAIFIVPVLFVLVERIAKRGAHGEVAPPSRSPPEPAPVVAALLASIGPGCAVGPDFRRRGGAWAYRGQAA